MVFPASLGEPGPPEVIVTLKVVSSDAKAGLGVISRPRCDDSRSTINDSEVEDPEYAALPAQAQSAGQSQQVYVDPASMCCFTLGNTKECHIDIHKVQKLKHSTCKAGGASRHAI